MYSARGSFVRNRNDFIICKGKGLKEKPPESRIDFFYNGEKFTNLGEFHNQAIKEFEEGNFDLGINKLEAIRNFDPLHFQARYNLGRFYFITKKFEKSKTEFLKSVELLPVYHRTYIHLADIEIFFKNRKKAEYYLIKSHEYNPYENDSLILLMILGYEDQMESRALRILKKIEESNDLTSFKIAKAIFHYLKKEDSKSFNLFIQIPFEDFKQKDFYYFKTAHFYFAKLSERIFDIEKAKQQYKEMINYPYDNLFREIDINNLKKKSGRN